MCSVENKTFFSQPIPLAVGSTLRYFISHIVRTLALILVILSFVQLCNSKMVAWPFLYDVL